ncbi:MAG: hypothetical protein LC700_01230, partial [Actinobacteria bacterium]|nr:hypothetical protein [Actinomycetota bacterium]
PHKSSLTAVAVDSTREPVDTTRIAVTATMVRQLQEWAATAGRSVAGRSRAPRAWDGAWLRGWRLRHCQLRELRSWDD